MTVAGKDIKAARLQAKLTLKQVASLYDYLTAATAWHWENESWRRRIGREPPDDIVSKISQATPPSLDLVNDASDDDELSATDQIEQLDEGVPDFGTWLREEREAKGLSVGQLAQAAGISVPQIYNIERGRTVNPQQDTRDRLAEVLGQLVPKEVSEKSERSQLVEGIGALVGFDPYDEQNLPSVPGVYVLYDISDRPVYVGKSQNIAKRLKSHADKFWYKRPIVESALYLRVDQRGQRHSIEQVLIKFLKRNAVLNKQSVDRGVEE